MQYIYTLSSPENPEIVKYVGYTNNPNKRYNKHLHSYKRGFNKIKCWIKSLHLKNLKPIMNVIDERETVEEIKKLEIRYIALYKSFGANLKNDTIGGEGATGHKHTNETKLKISKNNARPMLGKRKHNINDDDVKLLFLEGKSNSEIADILNCPSLCAIKESRKRQSLFYIKPSLKKEKINLTDVEVNTLIKMYNDNKELTEICKTFNFSMSSLRKIINLLNLEKRMKDYKDVLTPDILRKYYIDENKSKKEIAELTGATERNIKKRLKDWKITKTKEQFTELMNRVGRKTKVTEELKIKIEEDRKNKVTVKEMSEKYNISKNIINNYFSIKNKI